MTVLNTPLSTIPCFHELHLADISFLESVVSHEFVEAGEFLFKKGDAANAFYLVEKGTLALQLPRENKEPISLMTLNAGELIGWSWLIPPYQWNFDALALNACELLAFDAASIRRRMDWDTGFGYRAMKSLALTMHDRLSATRLQLLRHHDE